ncbi:hypothetical protein EDB81DRAFT_191272 [Dactylonectria macrodidyma]|uniref:Uncharacterized protein n=1 Tax=Dactylonectria macrodidyma TaxID=307937 RepID=A0A9P9FSV3_9HYPO|nr:hypothetical protein EDB81DRAFT_191272 [Dactylonectria macrodidyma]
MASHIPSPNPGELLAPFLPALPAASMSTQPAIGILPLLSPILRQRVNFLSSSSTEPWLRLLCYDTTKAAKLAEIAKGGSLEPHPVSGEVEVDWDYDAEIRFRRVDQETLQALVVLDSLGLAFQLLYCVGDKEGGGDGWRVGEVTVADKPSPFLQFGGVSTIAEAERQFEESRPKPASQTNGTSNHTLHVPGDDHGNDADDDDDYWARYDATPARTPAQKQSPAPPSMSTSQAGGHLSASTEDDYYAQYDDVQPAMDPHDPDEAAEQAQFAPPLGLSQVRTHESVEANELNETQGAWTLAELEKTDSNPNSGGDDADKLSALVHPRPSSSASSNGSRTVAKLEATADKQEQNEFGVKQHVSRSIRSLYFLARSSGINREEFERLIHTELDILGMVEDHD